MNAQTLLDNFSTFVDAPGGIPRLRELILHLAMNQKLLSNSTKSTGNSVELVELREILTLEYGKPLQHDARSNSAKIPAYGANGVKTYTKTPLVNRPGIVVGRKGSAGQVNITEGPYWPLDVTFYADFDEAQNDVRYLYYLLKSLDLPALARGIKPGINRNDVHKLTVFKITREVQIAIVGEVDELMALCDHLEAAKIERDALRTAACKSAIDAVSTASTGDELSDAWARIRDNWTTYADTPESVSDLRSIVLKLATNGHLTERLGSDGNALEVVNSMVTSRDADKTNPSRSKVSATKAAATNSEMTPPNWWAGSLGDICRVVMGNSPPGESYNTNGDGVPLVNGPVEFSPSPLGKTIKSKFTLAPTSMCVAGDLLVCVRGATTGRTNIAAFDACIGRGVALVRGYESQQYINLVMWSLGRKLLSLGKGTTFPSISFEDIAGTQIMLPPLSEQVRIVAKVHELMALCDRLESELKTRNDLAGQWAASIVHHIGDAA